MLIFFVAKIKFKKVPKNQFVLTKVIYNLLKYNFIDLKHIFKPKRKLKAETSMRKCVSEIFLDNLLLFFLKKRNKFASKIHKISHEI